MKITTFEQAKNRLADIAVSVNEIKAFLDTAENAIGAVNALKGHVAPTAKNESGGKISAPETGVDRVLTIFREENRTMRPTEVRDNYVERRWPGFDGDRRELYTTLISVINYLSRRKKLLVRSEGGGYRLKGPQE